MSKIGDIEKYIEHRFFKNKIYWTVIYEVHENYAHSYIFDCIENARIYSELIKQRKQNEY